MSDWLDKAKEAAKRAADEAKKLAEAAKNADYGAMLDKTKDMAKHAADEAKKAADNIIKKEQPGTQGDIIPPPDNPSVTVGQTTTTPPTVNPATPAAQPTVSAPRPTVAAAAPLATAHTDAYKAQVLSKIAAVEQLLQEIKALLK